MVVSGSHSCDTLGTEMAVLSNGELYSSDDDEEEGGRAILDV